VLSTAARTTEQLVNKRTQLKAHTTAHTTAHIKTYSSSLPLRQSWEQKRGVASGVSVLLSIGLFPNKSTKQKTKIENKKADSRTYPEKRLNAKRKLTTQQN